MIDHALTDSAKAVIEMNGEIVRMDTEHCITWKASHENCHGCSSEIPCCKLVSIELCSMTGNGLESSQLDEILKATSVEELMTVVDKCEEDLPDDYGSEYDEYPDDEFDNKYPET